MGKTNEYISFGKPTPSDSGKTQIWSVISHHDYDLGEIRWYGRWRKYAFYPHWDTIYEQDCLRKIADFCEDQTKKLRATWKTRKKSGD